MTHRLTTNYAKNYCNRTFIVKVIIENVVTCFFGTQCIIINYNKMNRDRHKAAETNKNGKETDTDRTGNRLIVASSKHTIKHEYFT